jgi:hypothetical protein
LSYAPLELIATRLSPAERVYLTKICAKGGKQSSGAGGGAVWKVVRAAERSRRMRAVVRARWAKEK